VAPDGTQQSPDGVASPRRAADQEQRHAERVAGGHRPKIVLAGDDDGGPDAGDGHPARLHRRDALAEHDRAEQNREHGVRDCQQRSPTGVGQFRADELGRDRQRHPAAQPDERRPLAASRRGAAAAGDDESQSAPAPSATRRKPSVTGGISANPTC